MILFQNPSNRLVHRGLLWLRSAGPEQVNVPGGYFHVFIFSEINSMLFTMVKIIFKSQNLWASYMSLNMVVQHPALLRKLSRQCKIFLKSRLHDLAVHTRFIWFSPNRGGVQAVQKLPILGFGLMSKTASLA